ncbi:hypothetical protein DRJ17_03075 [Candidatus Woesearchaeota archaeon]|nr:MAG: hypothetical protein DRJ17_03075 [Candidatus Woesearchaeota archaeon]
MKRLVIASDTFFPMYDGVTRFIGEIVPRLKNDFLITIIAPSYDKTKKEVWEGIPIIKMPVCRLIKAAGYPTPIPRFCRMWRIIEKADVVFVQSGPLIGGATILISKLLRKPVVMYMHQIGWEQLAHVAHGPKWWKLFLKCFTKNYARFFSNLCNKVIIPSKEIETILRSIKIKSDIVQAPLGIDVDEFTPTKDIESAKKAVGIDPSRIVIGYCGRISKEKGLDTLIEAFRDLNKKYKNLFLLVVGEGEKDIKEAIGKVPNTRITGFVKNVVDYYHAMDIFVLPSLTETTGLTILEAMSCQVPVVVTPVGFASYLKNKFNAMIFPKRSVYVLKKRLEILINDPNERKDIAESGRFTVEKRFTWTTTYRKIKRILMEY